MALQQPETNAQQYVNESNTTTFGEPLSVNDAGEVTGVSVDETLAERGSRYGSFEDHAEISQRLMWALKSHAQRQEVELNEVHSEALQMICHKLGRIVNGDPDYDDSWRDIAGYATLVEKWINGEGV